TNRTAARRSILIHWALRLVCPRRRARARHVDRILTAVNAAFLRAVLAATGLVAAFLLAGGAAQAAAPRVLAVHFESDVNPVTQDYLTDEIKRGNTGRYNAIAIVMDTP